MAAPILLTAEATDEEYILSWTVVDGSEPDAFTLHSIDSAGAASHMPLAADARSVSIPWGTDAMLFWIEGTYGDGSSSTSNFISGTMDYPRCPPLSVVAVYTNPPNVFIAWSCIDNPPIPPA